MDARKYTLEIPIEKPLKEEEKARIIDELSAAFRSSGWSNVLVEKVYYLEKRGEAETLSLVLNFVIATAEIIGVAITVSRFLKSRRTDKEVVVKDGNLTISIRGDMTNKEIINLIKAGGRVAGEKKHPGKH
jgi:hypothetical protein